MKSIAIGLLMAIVAIIGSSYKNSHKTISENFLVQTAWGIYTRSDQGEGICLLTSAYPCKYFVTTLGKIHIPDKLVYSTSDITTYVSNGWLWLQDGSITKIYLEL